MDNSAIASLKDTGNYLLRSAASRWLFPEEICVLLVYSPHEFGLEINHTPINNPTGGRLFVFPTLNNGSAKYDHVQWAKKKGLVRIQETYMNLKINGREMIRGIYCKSADNPNFRRRVYRLIKSDGITQHCIVHYRECTDDEKPERSIITPPITFYLNPFLLKMAGTFDQPALASSSSVTPTSLARGSSKGKSKTKGSADSVANMDGLEDIFMLHDDRDFSNTAAMYFSSVPNDQHQPQHTTQHPQPTTHYYPLSIVDFAPEVVTMRPGSHTKLLLCLSDHCTPEILKLRLINRELNEYLDLFTERITSSALRVILPALRPGRWQIYVLNQFDQVLFFADEKSLTVVDDGIPPATAFGFAPPPVDESPCSELGKRSHSEPSASHSTSSLKHSQQHSQRFQPANGLTSSFPLPIAAEEDREYKIRIVEKLGYVKNALLHEENQDHFNNHNTSNEGIAEMTSLSWKHSDCPSAEESLHWPEESELSRLSNVDLERLIDESIATVLQQLVDLAWDQDLVAEIDSPDAHGFSLLHYCALYNLSSLIPLLISHGAAVNQKAGNGSTALHLAVAAGHLEATDALLASGADCAAVDQQMYTPLDVARYAGFEAIAQLLQQKSPLQNDSPHTVNGDDSLIHSNKLPSLRDLASFDMTLSGEYASKDRELLQNAFASLSLTDKCALSLSFKQQHQMHSSFMGTSSPSMTPRTSVASPDRTYALKENEVEDDIQSVLSMQDDSLEKAMSLMGEIERQELDEEVRKIQNNVRGWIMRKNFNNLRQAAKVLQTAWRERKRPESKASHGAVNGDSGFPCVGSSSSDASSTDQLSNALSSHYDVSHHEQLVKDRAAATLQAATRRMIARKSFESIRKQTMASLVIQKNLMKWWAHHSPRHEPQDLFLDEFPL